LESTMMQICCECDWGMGVELPAHIHVTYFLVARRDGGYRGWIPNWLEEANADNFIVEQKVDEITFSVPWKELYRNESR
jgi:hypothetical protein